MRDILPTLRRWRADGVRFVTATVVRTWGSSPRPIGSMMGISANGAVVGSVSGGCVESAVMDAASQALEVGVARLLNFGELTNESVWEVGLSCGGKIEIWIEPEPYNNEAWSACADWVERDEPCALIQEYRGPRYWAWQADRCCPNDLPSEVWSAASEAVRARQSRSIGEEHFVLALPRKERLIIVGAVHISIPLVAMAKVLGIEAIVVDPRPLLADPDRFATSPDQLIAVWPHEALSYLSPSESDYAVVLTHDPKIDDNALKILLKSPVRYIGALGSRTTQGKRRKALAESGFSEKEIDRIHGPVGLSIGARSPEEIAVSIIAQIVQVRNADL